MRVDEHREHVEHYIGRELTDDEWRNPLIVFALVEGAHHQRRAAHRRHVWIMRLALIAAIVAFGVAILARDIIMVWRGW